MLQLRTALPAASQAWSESQEAALPRLKDPFAIGLHLNHLVRTSALLTLSFGMQTSSEYYYKCVTAAERNEWIGRREGGPGRGRERRGRRGVKVGRDRKRKGEAGCTKGERGAGDGRREGKQNPASKLSSKRTCTTLADGVFRLCPLRIQDGCV